MVLDASLPQGGASSSNLESRLGLLRAELKRRQIQGFVVPHADEYQSEYTPAAAARLEWLTGFTGSAGMAAVLEEKAAVFVDGRYVLQALRQVDKTAFELLPLGDGQPWAWITANLQPNASLGYDPNLHAINQMNRLKDACHNTGASLVALRDNPLDAVWLDRPLPAASIVVPHDIAFAGETSFQKRRKIAAVLKEEKLDIAILTAPDSVAWLLNIRGSDVPFSPLALAFAIIGADSEVVLFIDPRRLQEGMGQHLGDGVTVEFPDAFAAALNRTGAKGLKVRLDPDGPSAWIFERLKAAGASISLGADPCAMPKACKNRQELEGIRNAHLRDGVAMVRFLAWLSSQAPGQGLTELSAARQMEAFRAGGERYKGPSFAAISATGSNGAIIHYHADEKSNRLLEKGALYLIDSGGQYLDGTTDVTRTVVIGEPAAEMRVNFTRVLKGHIALAKARFPEGTTGSQLDALARKALWDADLDYDHGTGHGVGAYSNVHEGPQRIAKKQSSVPLKQGMVVSNEPGYYKNDAYGIRIENLMAVTPLVMSADGRKQMLGFETLTLVPIDLALVERSLLSVDEAVWLDAYHLRVQNVLKPYLDKETAEWLEVATLPVGWL